MKINDIIEKLEQEFPKELAYEWDNVGLLVGDRDREVKTVVTCLDVKWHHFRCENSPT